ncbi:MAG: DsbA family oxidoreductase [Proteobacteria bacterium]|nr:DsbA family oxidoreductase [Pseudomonadota bacterium]MBU1057343.1 DsbA family oxidoreductase [Pseudomonadota bacterium]
MADTIKLDIISDVVCPWCIIGYKRLLAAISELGIQDKVEIEWQPFELNPDIPAEGEEVSVHIARKYGMTPDESSRTLAHMTNLGAELGFKFDYFDGMKMVNTRDVHILLDYAKEFGKQTELQLRLFEAFFSERKDVSDRQILTQELQRVGLTVAEALARLDDIDTRNRVQAQEAYWHSLGVSSVPTMVFNRASSLTGAQPVDVYKQVLAELVEQ